MIKLTALRQHLITAVPQLRQGPERLLTFVERGAIRFARGQHLSHQYRVPAKIVITDYAGEIDAVVIPLLQWLSHYQPDLDEEEAVRVDAELLASGRWDFSLEVTLTERVVAKVSCETGRIESEHRMPEYPIEACPAKHWELHVKAPGQDDHELAAEWGSPDG